MPPSGFTKRNTDGLGDFYRSCTSALRTEKEFTHTPKVAVALEIESIAHDQHTLETPRSNSSTALLDLCTAFYQKLYGALSDNASWGDLEKTSKKVIKELCEEFESIKIEE
jgi:hypothetical protein